MLKKWLKTFFTDQRIAMVIRWWVAGAVYFFIGWGTPIGQQSMIGLTISLGLVLGLFNVLIINPSLRLLFNIGPKQRPQHENTFAQRLSDHLVEVLKTLFIVFNVAIIYQVINSIIIALGNLPSDSVPLPGEPIMFGVFYVLVFWYLEFVVNKLKEIIVSHRDAEEKK